MWKYCAATMLVLAASIGPARGDQSAASATRGAEPPIVIAGKFAPVTEQLLMPIAINGEQFWCSLDSGFSALLSFDQRQVERARLALEAAKPTPDGNPPSPGDRGATADVRVGALTLRNQSIIIRPFHEDMVGTDCVMGVGLLRPQIVEMDYISGRVTLFSPGAFTPRTDARAVPLTMRRNSPFLNIGIQLRDGTTRTASIVVDTGASYYALALVQGFVERSGGPAAVGPTAVRPDQPQAALADASILASRVRVVTVGPFVARDQVAALLAASIGLGGVDDGLLGAGFLRQFTVTFDFEGARMFLEPNRRFGQRPLFDASGVGFRKDLASDRYRVMVVLPDSVAARAGVRVADELVAVNNSPAQAITPTQLRDVLSSPGSRCELRLMRDGQEYVVTLALDSRL